MPFGSNCLCLFFIFVCSVSVFNEREGSLLLDQDGTGEASLLHPQSNATTSRQSVEGSLPDIEHPQDHSPKIVLAKTEASSPSDRFESSFKAHDNIPNDEEDNFSDSDMVINSGSVGDEIFCGMTFPSKDSAIEFVKKYSDDSKAAFVIRKSRAGTKAPLLFECKHGKKRESESVGKRPNQATVKMNCESHFRFYVRASGETVLKSFNLTHTNHEVNELIYKRDTTKVDDVALDTIKDMLNGKTKMIHMKNALESKGISLSSDQIRYTIDNILKEPLNIQSDKLASLLNSIKDDGGDVNIQFSDSSTVKVLQISTRIMKKGFMDAKPSCLQIDTTHDTNDSGYKLSFMVYKNGTTGKGEVASIAFMLNESEDSYRFAFSSFESLLRHKPSVILIDKVNYS